MPLSESAILVLYAIQNSADHSYAALCQQAGKSRGTIARALEELIAAGSITASARKFQQPIAYSLTHEAAGNNSTASLPQSKSLKVQKSKSPKVQSIALHDDDENVLKENNSSSCNPKTFELLDQRPDFRAQVFNLLGEWKLAGRKREQLADAIANLSDTPESILSDIQNIRAGAVQRATSNPAGLTVHILTEYTETRQIALFDVPVPESHRGKGRKGGLQRRPQIHYTDEQREQANQRAAEWSQKHAQEKLARAASPLPSGGVGGGGCQPLATSNQPLTSQHTAAWEAAKQTVAAQMNKGNFLVFLKAAQLVAVDGDRAHIVAPNQYAVDWLTHRAAGPLAAAWQTHTGAPTTLTFSVKQLEAAHV